MVTRPPAPLPAMPARSACWSPSSFMRAFMRGLMRDARGVRGHGQAVDDRRDARRGARPGIHFQRPALHRGLADSEPLCLILRDFDVAEHGADGVRLTDLDLEFQQRAAARRGDSHRGLVRLDLDDFLVRRDFRADAERQPDDRGLGDGFAELWHDDGNAGHGRKL